MSIELIQYDYYLDLSSENILFNGRISVGSKYIQNDPGLVLYSFSQCGDPKHINVYSFNLNEYLPVSLQSNKVYSLTFKTDTNNGTHEKRVWLDTHSSDLLNITGEIISDEISGRNLALNNCTIKSNVKGKSIILDNCTIDSGVDIYYTNSLEIVGGAAMSGDNNLQNTTVLFTDLDMGCLD
jgi:hypothetical protein